MLETKKSGRDRHSERSFLNYSVSFFSAVLVLCGVAAVTVGDAPIVPYKSSGSLSMISSDAWLPLRVPSVGKIPMLMFLPNFGGSDSFDISEGIIPEDALPVVSLTLLPPASMKGTEGVYINNEANKNINLSEILESKGSIELKRDNSVQVIIYHTHGTESYNYEGLSYYGDDYYSVHTSDTSENVVHIGQIVTERLREYGIGVVHDVSMYDAEGYTDAYCRSCEGVERMLALYPEARLILDLHRDTIVLPDGAKYRPVVKWKNKDAAQMMILVGTGKASAPNNHWITNLSVASRIQQEAEKLCENIMRPILLRNSGYNQHLSIGSLLVEMGTCGNSLEEAERAAEILSTAIINAFALE